jgi:hypothetical protein
MTPLTKRKDNFVAVMHGLDLQHRRRRQIVQKHATFNLRLDDAPVHFGREVGMRVKHARVKHAKDRE